MGALRVSMRLSKSIPTSLWLSATQDLNHHQLLVGDKICCLAALPIFALVNPPNQILKQVGIIFGYARDTPSMNGSNPESNQNWMHVQFFNDKTFIIEFIYTYNACSIMFNVLMLRRDETGTSD
jgi:hypothetical protein